MRATSARQLAKYATSSLHASSSDRAWYITVGLEIHAQLDTPGKLFSDAPNRFAGPLNEDLKPFDLSLPGSQPVVNNAAVILALRAALALNCTINRTSRFDRKHYFYPDQPAGYQITQHYSALAENGCLPLRTREDTGLDHDLEVGIEQVQLEQDTGKTMYFEGDESQASETLIDLNRTGSPLIEIVTRPCVPSGRAAGALVRKMQRLLRSIGVSEAQMEAGGMRCDVNVSVHFDGEVARLVGPQRRCEIKNLASARHVSDAVDAEALRQAEVLAAGGTIHRETRGYDVGAKRTFLIRSKESAVDYRYMPEPDLPIVRISDATLQRIQRTLPELPDAQYERLVSSAYGLQDRDARVLCGDRQLSALYDRAVERTLGLVKDAKAPRVVANWLLHELSGRSRIIEDSGGTVRQLSSSELSDLVAAVMLKDLTGTQAKQVLAEMLVAKESQAVTEIAARLGFVTKSTDTVDDIISSLVACHSEQADRMTRGDEKLQKWFVGQGMRSSKGRHKIHDIDRALQRWLQHERDVKQ
ncbi:hypothetical protein PYCC9005_001786 [Savitreella phatthalungensis]